MVLMLLILLNRMIDAAATASIGNDRNWQKRQSCVTLVCWRWPWHWWFLQSTHSVSVVFSSSSWVWTEENMSIGTNTSSSIHDAIFLFTSSFMLQIYKNKIPVRYISFYFFIVRLLLFSSRQVTAMEFYACLNSPNLPSYCFNCALRWGVMSFGSPLLQNS